jgi:cytochrome c peroxidase
LTRLAALTGVVILASGSVTCSHRETTPATGGGVTPPLFVWKLPPGIPTPRVPADNPMSDAKVALGRRLFYDTRLSGNSTYACASCHQQARAFTDGRARAIGSTGAAHARSAMSLTNVAFNVTFGWADPSLQSLEAQMAVPMFNEHPIELGLRGREVEIVQRFSQDTDRTAFVAAFPGEAHAVSLPNIVKAIAAFERTLISGDSPLDRYLYRDDHEALTEAARRGMALFFSKRLHCSECHSGFNLSGPVVFDGSGAADPVFHNTGLYDVDGRGSYPPIDRGLIDVTGVAKDMGRFRAPTLRNVEVTAPYMHDGSVPTLEAAVRHYARGGLPSAYKSDRLTGFRISAGETADLVAFLTSLTDRTFLTNPAFGPPR